MTTTATTEMCEVCGASVLELRRGRCWGCYSRWAEARPVGFGAACVLCNDRRQENLKSIELLGAWLPTCFNCAARAAALDPMPRNVAAIRVALGRERRKGERRIGKTDQRVFRFDRRTGPRRRGNELPGVERAHPATAMAPSRDQLLAVDDDMILEITELVEEINAVENSAGDEMTRIIDLRLPSL